MFTNKASWKYQFYNYLSKYKSRLTEDFHFIDLDNYVIYKEDDDSSKLRCFKFNRKLSKKKFESFGDAGTTILIGCNNKLFMKIPMKMYLKFAGVDKILVSVWVESEFDGQEIPEYESDVDTYMVDSINALCMFIVHYSGLLIWVARKEDSLFGFDEFDIKSRIMVVMNDGSVKTYKNNIFGFASDFNIPHKFFERKSFEYEYE